MSCFTFNCSFSSLQQDQNLTNPSYKSSDLNSQSASGTIYPQLWTKGGGAMSQKVSIPCPSHQSKGCSCYTGYTESNLMFHSFKVFHFPSSLLSIIHNVVQNPGLEPLLAGCGYYIYFLFTFNPLVKCYWRQVLLVEGSRKNKDENEMFYLCFILKEILDEKNL